MEERYQSESCVIGIRLETEKKNMICDSGMIGRGRQARVHLCTPPLEGGLTCHERDGGEEEIAE